MKISTRGRYGLRILLDIALYSKDKPRIIREIAEAQSMSEKYISRLVIDLRKAGLISSVRGALGGFKLAKDPKDISLLDTLEILEGPINIVECVRNAQACEHQLLCSTRQLWETVNNRIRESLAEFTLQDIIDKQISVQSLTQIDYCI